MSFGFWYQCQLEISLEYLTIYIYKKERKKERKKEYIRKKIKVNIADEKKIIRYSMNWEYRFFF